MKPLLKNKTILMMGAPGTGKGSYSKLISKRFGIPVYSTGEHLRKIIEKPNSDENKDLVDILSQKFQIPNVPQYLGGILSKGQLIRKEIMSILVYFTLQQISKTESNSIILDGYPRTLSQAKELDEVFARKIDLVININQHSDIIVKKLLGRRSCEKCSAAFNLTDINENGYLMPSMKPKKDGICDHCGGNLSTRSDDNAESIKDRLKTYDEKSKDILDFYSNKKVLCSSEMKKGFDDIGLLYKLVEEKLCVDVKH